MELYLFAWDTYDDDHSYSFISNADQETVMRVMADLKSRGGDVTDYYEFEKEARKCGITVQRHFYEEPTAFHIEELDEVDAIFPNKKRIPRQDDLIDSTE